MASSKTTEDIIALINSITQQSLEGDVDGRVRILAAAQRLCVRLETPLEFVQRVTWGEPSLLMCLKVADDVNLFKYIGTESSAPKSVEELAAATSVEPALLKRIARHLAARHILEESSGPKFINPNLRTATPDIDTAIRASSNGRLGFYAATHISAALATREGSSGVRHACNVYYPNFLDMPKLLREQGYVSPKDNRDGPLQRRYGLVGSTSFECLQRPEHRALADDFNLLMKFTTQERRSFLDVCDVGELLRTRPFSSTVSDSASESSKGGGAGGGYLLVDVGGGTGTDVLAFRRRFPNIPGKVELQDLPAVIDTAASVIGTSLAKSGTRGGVGDSSNNDSKIELRSHDFFNEQPVYAPRFFFMGSVLHDWPDNDAVRILHRLSAAMKPAYSTLLLSENVLRESSMTNRSSRGGDTGTDSTHIQQKYAGNGYSGCHPHLSAIDLTMMTSLASKERSESDWAELLAKAGLRIVKIHSIPSCLKSVLECELVG